jgi:hypothetical protein
MRKSKQPKRQDLVGPAETKHYAPMVSTFWTRPRDLPVFTFYTVQAMLFEPTVKLGLATRLAFMQGAKFGTYQEGQFKEGCRASSDQVADFVDRTLRTLWTHIDKIASSQTWGWSGSEILFSWGRGGTVEVRDVAVRHAMDVRVLMHDGEPCGVRFLRCAGNVSGVVDLPFPKALWHAHDPEPGTPYGRPILIGSYSPWADKWLNGGALDVRRLFMHKDAYGGADLSYPEGTTYIEGIGDVPNRDIARQIVEQLMAGSVSTRPTELDDKGNPLWDLKRAQVPPNPQHILQYPTDLDREITRGMEIPDDVMSADNSGAWEGKKVPMTTFLASLDRFAGSILRACKTQALTPLVRMNFGPEAWYDVQHQPLVEQIMGNGQPQEQPGAAPPMPGGGAPVPLPGPIQMSALRSVTALRMALSEDNPDMPKLGAVQHHYMEALLRNGGKATRREIRDHIEKNVKVPGRHAGKLYTPATDNSAMSGALTSLGTWPTPPALQADKKSIYTDEGLKDIPKASRMKGHGLIARRRVKLPGSKLSYVYYITKKGWQYLASKNIHPDPDLLESYAQTYAEMP